MLHYVVSKVLAENPLWNLAKKHADDNVASVNRPIFVRPFAPALVVPPGITPRTSFSPTPPSRKQVSTLPHEFVDVGYFAGLEVIGGPPATSSLPVVVDLTEVVIHVGEIYPEPVDEVPNSGRGRGWSEAPLMIIVG